MRLSRFAAVSCACFLAAFCSCLSAGKPAPEDAAREYSPADLAAMVGQEPERALSLSTMPPGDGPAYETEGITVAVRRELEGRFDSAISEKRWLEALRFRRSLSAIASAGVPAGDRGPAWTEAAIMEALADSLAEQGDSGRALLWYGRAFAAAAPEAKSVAKAWRLAAEKGNLSAQRALMEAARKAGAASAAEIAALESSKPPFKDMVKGVCTIWVNKGLKVESGVAVPDRVIGSGFFIDERGYLLTNYHVIASEVDPEYEGYSRLFIRMSGMKEERVPAKVVGWDRNLDLALLKAAVTPDFVFSVSPGRVFSPGDKIYAIGSPVGLESTITSGIVSAAGREEILPLGEAIQVDVAVNPGNSGGPLLDENGDVAGVVFAGLLEYQGLNFAIPSDWVASALDRLYSGGEAEYAFAGISALQEGQGLRAVYALHGSPAREFGVKNGDLIESIDGKPMADFREASAYILSRDPGTLVRLGIDRQGEKLAVYLPLAKRPYLPMEGAFGKDPKERLFAPLFGMDVELVSKDLVASNYRILRIFKGKLADEAGLSEDDPFSLRAWKVDKENKAVILQLYVKRRKQGFLETIMQLPASFANVPFL